MQPTLDAYPSVESLMEKKVYNVERAANRQYAFIGDRLDSEGLWELQQKVFHAKMDMLKFLVAHDMLPCKPGHLEVEIRLVQDSLPSEATDGKIVELPEDRHEIVVARLNSRGWLN